MTNLSSSALVIRDLYARMLYTRIVDDFAWSLHEQGYIDFVASCRGHEAAQVGSALCIEVGKDFTLPYYRDLGVVLTIGMTPYEVFRTYLQAHSPATEKSEAAKNPAMLHWGYHKHNTVTGPAPIATQILHAAGIAFASKLRKAAVVTVAYCSDSVTAEADFLEGIRFAALHQLPVVFVCEQDVSIGQPQGAVPSPLSCAQKLTLPEGLTYRCLDGGDVMEVYAAMQSAMQHARDGHGPLLLEMCVQRYPSILSQGGESSVSNEKDPLLRCQQLLQAQGVWDEEWAAQLRLRFSAEVERAMQDALRDLNL